MNSNFNFWNFKKVLKNRVYKFLKFFVPNTMSALAVKTQTFVFQMKTHLFIVNYLLNSYCILKNSYLNNCIIEENKKDKHSW